MAPRPSVAFRDRMRPRGRGLGDLDGCPVGERCVVVADSTSGPTPVRRRSSWARRWVPRVWAATCCVPAGSVASSRPSASSVSVASSAWCLFLDERSSLLYTGGLTLVALSRAGAGGRRRTARSEPARPRARDATARRARADLVRRLPVALADDPARHRRANRRRWCRAVHAAGGNHAGGLHRLVSPDRDARASRCVAALATLGCHSDRGRGDRSGCGRPDRERRTHVHRAHRVARVARRHRRCLRLPPRAPDHPRRRRRRHRHGCSSSGTRSR